MLADRYLQNLDELTAMTQSLMDPNEPRADTLDGEAEAAERAGQRLLAQQLEMPTLTKAELAEILFDQIGLNKRESKDMVDQFFALVHEALLMGQDVKLSGFGNFHLRDKSQRPGRNPRTGEAIPIQARRVVTFHASHKLKEQVQTGRAEGLDFE